MAMKRAFWSLTRIAVECNTTNVIPRSLPAVITPPSRAYSSSAAISPATTTSASSSSSDAQFPSPRPRSSMNPRPRLRQPKRHFTTTLSPRKDAAPSSTSSSSTSTTAPSKKYTFEEIQDLSSSPSPSRILIDVREPGEIASTGKIPSAVNIPISSASDSFFLPADEFQERYGFARPTAAGGEEVVFYCKAGVRSRAAAELARQAGFGAKVAEFPGSWIEWSEKGGEVERA